MRFIFSFFLCMAVISTTFADTQPSCSQYNNNQSDCYNAAGCKWLSNTVDIGGEIVEETECQLCDRGEYKPEGGGLNCLPCNSTTYIIESGKVALPQNQQSTGQSECPWTCADGYFEDNAENGCIACPPSTYQTNDWYVESSVEYANIGQCSCGDQGNLIKTNLANGSTLRYYCGTCGVAQDLLDTTTNGIIECQCSSADNNTPNSVSAIHVYGENSTRTQQSQHTECGCPNYSNASSNSCVCDTNYVPSTDNAGNPICSACLDNAHTTQSGSCICNTGYYGNGNPGNAGCTQCPAGTTRSNSSSTPATTTKKDCHVSSCTQFCNSQGKNCLQLVPGNCPNQQYDNPNTSIPILILVYS